MISTAKRRQGTTGTDWESVREDRGGRLDGGSISRRVGDHHDDVLEAGIASLEFDPPELRLDIVDPRFGFGWKEPGPVVYSAESTDDAIPRAQVVLDR